MAERWFFAIWPEPGAREALTGQLDALIPPRARRTHPLDLHLTLVFLGEIDTERLRCAEAAAGALRGDPFPLRIDRVGWFPRSRVLWCGPSTTPAPLQGLFADLQDQLRTCGFTPESRPYQPHVTLARDVRRRPQIRPLAPVEWTVSTLVLAAGQSGGVPRYQVHRRWRLGEDPAATRHPGEAG